MTKDPSMNKDELLDLKFEPKCSEKHCFFYAKQFQDCIFNSLTISEIFAVAKKRKLNADLFMSINSCPPAGKNTIDDYKMGLLLLE